MDACGHCGLEVGVVLCMLCYVSRWDLDMQLRLDMPFVKSGPSQIHRCPCCREGKLALQKRQLLGVESRISSNGSENRPKERIAEQ